jgi:hypothetical protein
VRLWFRNAIVAATVAAWSIASASDPPLYLVDTPFDPLPSGIYLVQPATGAMTLRASLDVSLGPILGLAAANESVFYASGGDAKGCFNCFLWRITLAPGSTVPQEVLPIGPFLDGTTPVDGVTGMTFRSDGTLWMIDEHAHGLFVVDPDTAAVTRIGTVSIEILGGDITFDPAGTMWLWSNAPASHGLHQLDPQTAIATPFILRPDVRLAGLASLSHSSVMYGASPFIDSLYEILIPSGFTGFQPPLVLKGTGFDHKRGDLASPFCTNDAYCDDADPCTTDTCAPGGCAHAAIPGCCTSNADCDDGNPCTAGEACSGGTCIPGTPVEIPEVAGIQAGADKSTLSWTAAANMSTYDAVRGRIDELPVGGAGLEECLGGLTTPMLSDPTAPPSGSGFWYIVRGRSLCATGSYGAQSDGTPRATPACP